jgi:uncharacterized protein with GYD domain
MFRKTWEDQMALYLCQIAYTAESWAAQVKNPQNRMDTVGPAACEAGGGKCIGAWLCFGEYDAVLIADMPDMESMAGVLMAFAAGGALKSSKTTPLMTGTRGIEALKKAATVAQSYRPAR